ncbi:uncharacterized protein GGS22DRAFT_165540 [Annulohypoxylon maeteangense]|uniref:uncharacterized protein n=1 Tax=Annulohypoxylon maeteangense TaxID=1927788 RepID=UPI002008E91A|nr:uncharacterized protein GGS22DRAFT_165540 [Annulohypoxylon maeteangense]KAI0884400.1 hypothetical protein GGS22DRAFT_165540 [Annulohypoxylon maeteangense]
MAHPRCLLQSSPARALHRVLVSDLSTTTSSPSRQTTATYLLPPRLLSSYTLLSPRRQTHPPPNPSQTRPLSTTPALQRILSFGQRLTNSNIPYRWVRIAEDGVLSEPKLLNRVLATLDPKTHTLVMVAPPPEREPSDSESADFEEENPITIPAAVCRIVDNAAAAAAAAEIEAAARRRALDTKELELSWSITPHDLSHKLKKMRGFLSKGLSVEVILAKKRGGRAATKEEAMAVLDTIRENVEQVDGAKETRKMDGSLGGVAKLFFAGPSEKKRKRKKQPVEEEELVED